jgi:hypothetical protein
MSSSITTRNDFRAAVALNATNPTLGAMKLAQAAPDIARAKGSALQLVSGISVKTGQALQGELMYGRSGSGKAMFWLQGEGGKRYELNGADGKPVTNAMDAETRARKIITNGGATQLRETPKTGTEVKAPGSDGKLRFNLEDLSSKRGGGVSKGGILGQDRGERGSALTSTEAVQAFESQGDVPVKVFNGNPQGSAKNARMGAMVELSDNASGGKKYADATVNRNPGELQPDAVSYSLPPGASVAFKRGYADESAVISAATVTQATKAVSEGRITAAGTRARAPSITPRPITTETALPRSPAGTSSQVKPANVPSAPPGLEKFTRRPGESMSDYLTRQKVAQSLTPEQQRVGENMRMSAVPPPSGHSSRMPIDRISMAIKMKNFNNTASAIANPRTFDTLLNHVDKLPMSVVVRIGNTGPVHLDGEDLKSRTETYRNSGRHNLSPAVGLYFYPQMQDGKGAPSHEPHTFIGAVSKLGEVHANSGAFTLADDSWASRSLLPGRGGKPIAQFWKIDSVQDWGVADRALTSLARADPQLSRDDFAELVMEPLRDTGFISKGTPLAARLERLEATVATREALQRQLNTAGPAQVPALNEKLQTATQQVQAGLNDLATGAKQSRGELLMQSLGTPKTTYELTIRHATMARYIASIVGQPDAVFSAAKFKSLMAEVKKEAGPEAEVSRRWHSALIKRYGAEPEFQSAMAQSPAMKQAWADYKAQHGK